MSERTERVEELFEAVLEQAPEDREQFLKKACGDDTSLRNEVETLVRHHEGAELSGFLDQRDAEGAGESVGVDDGRYVVVEKHAAGSLGEVLVALDKDFERDVALKRVLPTMANDPLCRRRFEMEAKITGRLEHPGIVPVYSRGKTSDGEAFYAMKFIEGETMKAAIEQLHEQSRSKTQWNDNLRALLRRFIDVCHAIDYAHSRGVVHRDLKPANVVLGKFGESMVVDWGIAKLVDAHEDSQLGAEETLHLRDEPDAAATRTGSYLGTPAYMSPEQATGRIREVGPRSDVFGLGAMLYHILTGKPPYQGRDGRETLVLASQGKWKFPRTQKVRRIPFGLRSVCDRAMATESSERYTSAGELAADVENWLEDRPLIGNPDDVPEMIARFYRLNPLLATGVTLFVLVDIPIFCQLLLGTHTAFEFVVISTFSSIAGGMGLGQVFSLPGALLGGLLGLIRGKGNWRDRTLSGAKTGFSQGLIIGCSTGVFLALTSTFFDYQYMPKNSEGVRTPPKELIVFMFVFACYVVSAIVGNIFLRLARQGERSWTFNLHLGMGWILAWTILFNFYLINEDFEGNLRASFLDLFPSDGHLLAIRDFATRLIQSTLVGMLVGYGLGGFVGLLSGIFQGRIFDRAITGSRIGMFVFAGIAVVLVIGDLIF